MKVELQNIVAIVRRAGDMIRDAQHIERDTYEKSCAADLVTKYDVAVQAFLRQELLNLCPEADFLGEEGQHDKLTREWVFVVDPIDGTTNFVRQLHYSNIAVALCCRGEVRYAVVYNPFAEELYAAEKGCGATLNGQPIQVTQNDPGHAICMCGSTIYDRTYTDHSFTVMRWLYDHTLDFRRFGAAELDICQVAAGRIEVFFECRLSPWDFAAGSLILSEAGGSLTRLDGSPVDPYQPGSVWATNEKCRELYRQLPQ